MPRNQQKPKEKNKKKKKRRKEKKKRKELFISNIAATEARVYTWHNRPLKLNPVEF